MKNVFIVSALLLLGAGCLVRQPAPQAPAPMPLPPATVTTTEHVEEVTPLVGPGGETIGEADISLDLTTTVDCASVDCFEPKFAACEPATMVQDAGFASVSYKILQPTTDGCLVQFMYPTNPNPAWANQPMDCVMDRSLPFEEALQEALTGMIDDPSICTGPLADLIRT